MCCPIRSDQVAGCLCNPLQSGTISLGTLTLAAFAVIAVGLVIGACGLAGRVSMTTVATTNMVTALVNPFFGVPIFIVGLLGVTGVITNMTVMSGVLVASQAVNLTLLVIALACSAKICDDFLKNPI